jgi:hypothetical protein
MAIGRMGVIMRYWWMKEYCTMADLFSQALIAIQGYLPLIY